MSKMFIDGVHAQNVLQRMWQQTERKELCDVSLIAGDNEEMQISAHRSVLCASSEFFETMFKPPFNESIAKEVKLPNVDGETLKALVKFCYSGRLEMNEDNAEKLLITADSLLLEPVFNACGNYLAEQLHPSNCLGIAQLAERHHCDALSKKAIDFCMKNFVELYKSDEFLNLSVEQLTQLLSSDDLCDPTEEHVFKSLMLWLEHNRSEREQYKDEMLKLVRLPFLKPQFLSAHVQQVCTSPVSLKFYTETTDWHLLPKRRTVIASEFTEPRRRGELLMAIRRGKNKMYILYHCPQKFKWMKWLENLKYRPNFGVAIMGDDLFILGGYARDVVVNTVICLNLKTMNLKNVNPMNECRGGLGAAVINGFLYAVGGWNGHDLSSVEKWDSKSNTWTMVTSMSDSRCFFGITAFNGKMYVVGGGHDNDTVVNSAECYNPQENVWTSIASMCAARKFVKLAVANGILYAVGGNGIKTMERYNHERNTWTMMCSFSEKIIYGSICTTFNDKLIAVYMDRVEEYNSETNMCKVNTSITGLENVMHTFTFSGLLDSKFIED